ncbi:hypothetical protein [Haloferula sp. A504]|uniref:hypothetical protein n=1 Tax=Haloferula sp. A504 TaxID=3373601 RepID=UPI0031C0CD88|nr:hypothetical protein [Verrucomicrobiaceae bacterium E54]
MIAADHDAEESLRLHFERDELSGLPLIGEAPAVLELTLNFLPLPHSVVEFGCGKKASLILDLLARHGVPVHGLQRGLILEGDLSPDALEEQDHHARPRSLHVANPLYRRASLDDEPLRRMMEDEGFGIDDEQSIIRAGDFELHHVETVGFAIARSHVYSIVTFWDPDEDQTADLVIDPTLDRERMFPVAETRDYLHGPEALVFSAPMLGRFRLDPEHLTDRQGREVDAWISGPGPVDQRLRGLDVARHAELVRKLTGAPAGSIGDPETWSYANNIRPSGDRNHDDLQTEDTGVGEGLRALMRRLRNERPAASGPELEESRRGLHDRAIEMEVRRRMTRDAVWSGKKLEPLARLAAVVSSHLSLKDLANSIREGRELPLDPANPDHLKRMRGAAVRLRQRIERLALASTDEAGTINASALTLPFMRAAAETIAQMNRAGMTVFIDRVGNLHGLHFPAGPQEPPGKRQRPPGEFCVDAICHASHIDTVSDAGKHDGRLGVVAGIEIAQTVHDLKSYFEVAFPRHPGRGNLMVTAFIGEEMTYSGEGVVMPGSSAVAGHAPVESVHRMTNAAGERFIDGLLEMLRYLEERRRNGDIHFENRFPADGDSGEWIDACPRPGEFFTPHTYERHIEQGPELNRGGVPLVLVDRVMGIRQEDVSIHGRFAGDAALEFGLRLRELVLQPDYRQIRVTVGIVKTTETGSERQPASAWRCQLRGRENHAGSTPTRDRRDPVVAAARLAREFRRRAGRTNPVAGDLEVRPGTNRNVIPGTVALTLGTDDDLTQADQEHLRKRLTDFISLTLGRDVDGGGEGVVLDELRRVRTVRNPGQARLSIDVRGPRRSLLRRFRSEIRDLRDRLSDEFGVELSRETVQHFEPQSLAESGQVLQLERSYGGSHSPTETEMASDLLRGTLIQLAVTADFQRSIRPPEAGLRAMALERVPEPWCQRLPGFESGALHDTCNIARSTARESDETSEAATPTDGAQHG